MKDLLLLVSKAAFHPWWKSLFRDFVKTLRSHSVFIFIVLFYFCALLATALVLKVIHKNSFFLYSETIPLLSLSFFTAFFVGHAIYVMVFVRPEKLITYTFPDLWFNYLKRERLLNGLPILLFMPLFMSAFTSFKTLIPVINPFSWDSAFSKFDALILGGHQPWQLCQLILGHHLLISGINFIYNLWLFVMFAVLYWQTFSIMLLTDMQPS